MGKNIFMFDVESDGLYGKGFAVGAVVYEDGYIIDSFELKANTNISSDWVKENVLPHLENMPTCPTCKELRTRFYEFYMKHKDTCYIYSDCNYPVETNFLNDIVQDNKLRCWDMPFPLMDIATSDNINMSRSELYKKETGRTLREHNPLDDAKASLHFLLRHY
jgi:hypothetical protein